MSIFEIIDPFHVWDLRNSLENSHNSSKISSVLQILHMFDFQHIAEKCPVRRSSASEKAGSDRPHFIFYCVTPSTK